MSQIIMQHVIAVWVRMTRSWSNREPQQENKLGGKKKFPTTASAGCRSKLKNEKKVDEGAEKRKSKSKQRSELLWGSRRKMRAESPEKEHVNRDYRLFSPFVHFLSISNCPELSNHDGAKKLSFYQAFSAPLNSGKWARTHFRTGNKPLTDRPRFQSVKLLAFFSSLRLTF